MKFATLARRDAELKLGAMVLPLLVIIVFAVVQGFRFGFSNYDYSLLIFGSLGTFIFAFGYAFVAVGWQAEVAEGKPKHKWLTIFIIGGLFPYLFCLYLVLYQGLWSLLSLIYEFSLTTLVKALVFLVLGNYLLKQFYLITEIGRNVKNFYKANNDNES